MVRLVFRPYTQLRQSICTSELLRSSIRVSPDFNLARHSSPSFGSQHLCSAYSQQCEVDWKSRGWGIIISNGSLKIGTAGRKWCTIIWNKSTVMFNASGICGAAGTTCTPLYRTRERVVISSAMCRCNGSQNFGTAGRKWCSIIWNKSRTLSSAQTNYCPFGLPMFSLINSSYVRGSKAIRYRPSSNHKRCQLAIC